MPRLQFKLSSLLFIIALVAVFLWLRSNWMYGPGGYAPDLIRRAQQIPPMCAALAVLGCAWITNRDYRLRKLLLTGAVTAGLAATFLATEICEGVRRSMSDYWVWLRDWPTFVGIVLMHTAIGATFGAVVGVVLKLRDAWHDRRLPK